MCAPVAICDPATDNSTAAHAQLDSGEAEAAATREDDLQDGLQLTPEEKEWLAQHSVITLGFNPHMQPLLIEKGNGQHLGILPELVVEFEKVLGIKIQIPIDNWETIVNKARSKEIDGLLVCDPNKSESRNLITTDSLFHDHPIILTRDDAPFEISSLNDLNELNIAYHKGVILLEVLLEKYTEKTRTIPVESSLEAMRLVLEKKADAAMALSFENYQVGTNSLTGIKLALFDLDHGSPIVIGIRDDWPVLAGVLNKALRHIGPAKIERICTKWSSGQSEKLAEFAHTQKKWNAIWLDQVPDPWTILKWAGLIMGPLVVLLLVALIWNKQLRQAVSKRTMEMEKTNDSLIEIKQRFEAVYNHHYQLTGLLDIEGRLLMANKKATDFGDLKLQDILGMYFWDTPFWSHSEEAQSALKQGIEKALLGEFVQFETTHPSKTEELRIFDFCLTPVFDDDGSVIYIVPEGYDITARKQIEKALRLSEERNKAIVDNSPIAIVLLDTIGIPLSCNNAFEELLGYSSEELQRVSPREYTHPDDKEASRALYKNVIAENPPFGHLEKRYLHKDGSVIWVNLHVNLVKDQTGQSDFIIAMVENISKRKQTEQEIKSQLNELQRWHKVTVGREERMQKLKDEVNDLTTRLGENKRYN